MSDVTKVVLTTFLLTLPSIACSPSGCVTDPVGGQYCIADSCWANANSSSGETLEVPDTKRYDAETCNVASDVTEYKTVTIMTNAAMQNITLNTPSNPRVFHQAGTAEAITVNDGEYSFGSLGLSAAFISKGLTATGDSTSTLVGGSIYNSGQPYVISASGNAKVKFQIASSTIPVGNIEIKNNAEVLVFGGSFYGNDIDPETDFNTSDINTIKVGYDSVAGEVSRLTIVGSYNNSAAGGSTCTFVDSAASPIPDNSAAHGIITSSGECNIVAAAGTTYDAQGNVVPNVIKLKLDAGPNALVIFQQTSTPFEQDPPASLNFVDTNPTAAIGNISGNDDAEIGRAINEGLVGSYVLRWGKGDRCNITSGSFIGETPKTGASIVDIPMSNKTLPSTALELLAYSKSYILGLDEGADCISGKSLPINTAQGLPGGVVDTDLVDLRITGNLNITKALNESNFDKYRIYFGNSACDKPASGLVAVVDKTGSDIVHAFNQTVIPITLTSAPTVYMTVTPYNSVTNKEMACVSVAVQDN